MKRRILYIALIMMAVTGCRERGDVYMDPNDPMNMSYTTYAEQFDIIWRGINTHYVFWSEDKTNWDDVYQTMMPKFRALDSIYVADTTVVDSVTYVKLYSEACSTLIDHHMAIMWRDVHTNKKYVFRPGENEVRKRDYTQGQVYTSDTIIGSIKECITKGLLDGGRWGKWNKENNNFFGTVTLENGKKIAYLWQDAFMMNQVINSQASNEEEAQYIKNIQNWMKMCLSEPNLAGVILDNRNNRGGAVKDLNLIVSPFITKPIHFADVRYKEGTGRYEYTAWEASIVDTVAEAKRNLEAEHIPYVVLTNAYSISMGESSSMVIKLMPTGHMIGERTFGAHGMLINQHSIFYNGTFGNQNDKHYIYTANLQVNFTDGGILEGVGITPDEEALQADLGYDGVLQKALDYIKGYK